MRAQVQVVLDPRKVHSLVQLVQEQEERVLDPMKSHSLVQELEPVPTHFHQREENWVENQVDNHQQAPSNSVPVEALVWDSEQARYQRNPIHPSMKTMVSEQHQVCYRRTSHLKSEKEKLHQVYYRRTILPLCSKSEKE